MGMSITDVYQTLYDEADEWLADIEQHSLLLDPRAHESEELDGIFRAAHSIKGGAATFGFTVLQETTHLLENLLDGARRAEMSLSTDIINLFLETKDIMQEQLDAYKSSRDPDAESFEYICAALRQLALEAQEAREPAPDLHVVEETPAAAITAPVPLAPVGGNGGLRVRLSGLKAQEVPVMLEELGNLGEIKDPVQTADSVEATLITTVTEDDIIAVLCFVLEP